MSLTSNGSSPLIYPAPVHLRRGLFGFGFGCPRVRRVLSVRHQATQLRIWQFPPAAVPARVSAMPFWNRRRLAFQLHGRSPCRRVCGESAMRSRTPASQACGSTSFNLAVPIRVYITAARSPPRSEPANTGSTIPLPETESIRAATGDPRPSIEQRYGDADGYVAAIVTAAERLVADGLMLEEDIARVEQRARNWSRPLHDVRL